MRAMMLSLREAKVSESGNPILFPEPIETSIGDTGMIKFDSVDGLERWANEVKEFWEKLQSEHLQKIRWAGFQNALRAQVSHPNTILERCKRYRDNKKEWKNVAGEIRSTLEHYTTERALHPSSRVAATVERLLSSSPEVGAALLYTYVHQGRDASPIRDAINTDPAATATAFSFRADLDFGFGVEGAQVAARFDQILAQQSSAAQDVRNETDRLRIDRSAAVERMQTVEAESRAELQKFLADQTERVSASIAEHHAKLQELQALYREKTRVAAPTKYWGDRRDAHRLGRRGFGGLFAVFVVGLAIVLFWLRDIVVAGVSAAGDKINYPNAAVLAAVAFLTVWFLRFLYRQHAWHAAQETDSAERVSMIETFLALMQDGGKVDEKDRALVLAAIFRPAAAAGNEDWTPTSLIELLVKQASGDGKPATPGR
jgi:hypothetical protein